MKDLCVQSLRAVQSHLDCVDGLGYTVERVKPGRGFSATEYSSKRLSNGRHVSCMTFYPGPFDALAGRSAEITTTYSVWVGWEEYNPENEALYDSPPMQLPAGATGWADCAWDGPREWFAEFPDAETAEAFAGSLSAIAEDETVPPFPRPATPTSAKCDIGERKAA